MAQTQQAKKSNNKSNATNKPSLYSAVVERFNNILGAYSNLPLDSIYAAFGRAANYWNNLPSVQNSRVKALNPLPCDYSKQELNEFLVNPASSEYPLQQVAEGLRWTNYSFNKTVRSYADMLQFHSLILPQHATADEIKSDEFKREYRLVEKVVKSLAPKQTGRKTATQAGYQGKVFYVPRYSVDKSHNKCHYLFMQQLPTGRDWTKIIGLNNVSGWTVSFNLMYFMQPGTNYRQFGDLFEPYMKNFDEWVTAEERKAFKKKFIYASRNNADSFEYEAKAWQQNSRWFYYVTLPIDRVWTFEIDDSTAITVSPFAGLMQTYAQQADYEAAQLSLIMNPLIKIFTGEIPYYQSNEAKEDDGFRLSLEGRALFEAYFNSLMAQTNTGGVGLFSAPLQNLKSHDFPEASNANAISQSFLNYGVSKSGLSALVATTPDPKQGFQEYAAKLESQFDQNIYQTFNKMLNYILESLNLRFEWRVSFWGDIYSDELVRSHALKLIDKGDLWGFYLLCSLDDISIYERLNVNQLIKASGFIETLTVVQNAYTQSSKSQVKETGAPTKTETDVTETKIEKQTESTTE